MTIERVEALLRELGEKSPPQPALSVAARRRTFERLNRLAARAINREIGREPTLEPARRPAYESAGSSTPSRAVLAAWRPGDRLRSRLAFALAAAALLFFMPSALTPPPRPSAPPLVRDVRIASTADGLFRVSRSADVAAPDQPLYIGVDLARPAYLRLLAHDDRGDFTSLALDRSGASTQKFLVGTHRFGAFATVSASPVASTARRGEFIIIASSGAIADADLDELLSANRANELRVTVDILKTRLSAEVWIVPVEK